MVYQNSGKLMTLYKRSKRMIMSSCWSSFFAKMAPKPWSLRHTESFLNLASWTVKSGTTIQHPVRLLSKSFFSQIRAGVPAQLITFVPISSAPKTQRNWNTTSSDISNWCFQNTALLQGGVNPLDWIITANCRITTFFSSFCGSGMQYYSLAIHWFGVFWVAT